MLKQLITIFMINYMGIIISKTLKLPIPGTIIGLILFFLLLYYKFIKIEQVENGVNALLLNMTILFMPPTVKILDSVHMLQGQFIKALILIILTTFITMGVTGKIVQFMIELTESKRR
ncbi:MAG: CidA/LrgA family protein [Fusobacterium sp.]|nr:CidA/LrgA family protein [Fusobacterium sp.]